MARLVWDSSVTPNYTLGVEKVVLYAPGRYGVVWNGIQAITTKPEGAAPRTAYLDGEKIVHMLKTEECSGTIEAYQSPIEFDRCDGSYFFQGALFRPHMREPFDLAFCSRSDRGPKLHIIYNAMAEPTSRDYITSYEPEATTLLWKFTTKSMDLFGYHPTASITIDLSVAAPGPVQQVLDILYGTIETQPRCPTPDEILTIFGVFEALEVIDHGDGSFTVMGSDSAVSMTGDGEFQLSASVVELLEEGTYQIHYTLR